MSNLFPFTSSSSCTTVLVIVPSGSSTISMFGFPGIGSFHGLFESFPVGPSGVFIALYPADIASLVFPFATSNHPIP